MKHVIIFIAVICISMFCSYESYSQVNTIVRPDILAMDDIEYEALCDSTLAWDTTGSSQTEQYLQQRYQEYETGFTQAQTPTTLRKTSGTQSGRQMKLIINGNVHYINDMFSAYLS